MAQTLADDEWLELSDAMHGIAPGWIRYDIRRISDEWVQHLHPEELAISQRFARARRAEFATGRASVRGLIPDLARGGHPILVGERRAPIFPHGVHASISHCETFVASVATEAGHIEGLGVDIERLDRVTPELSGAILSRSEAANRQAHSLARYFSSKEAVFKAIHGLIGKYIDFLEVDLTFCAERFTAQPLFTDPKLEDINVEGVVAERGRHVLAIAWASSAPASVAA